MYILDFVTFILLLEVAGSQEVATPSSLLGPRNFNYHAFDAKRNSLMDHAPTRKGPVLFPNDAPSASNRPETTTSRVGSIRTNISSDNANTPTFLAPVRKYVPMVYGTLSPSVGSDVIDDYYDNAPYTDIVKKSINGYDLENSYRTFQQSTSLPPIYNALSQHANRNLLNTQRKAPSYHYEPQKPIQYDNSDPSGEGNSENMEDKSYAFSYIVKDQKTGDDFSHSQRSSGSATNGEYRVRLPDGRLQIVSYTADENGYKADVRYDVDTTSNSVEYSESRSPDQLEYTDNLRYIPDQHNRINQNAINQKYSFNLNSQQYDPTGSQYNPVQFKQDYVNKEYSNPSKEYYDYSAEYDNSRTPYKSKFAALYSGKSDLNALNFGSTTSRPSYDLEEVLAKALPNVRPTLYSYSGTESTTNNPILNIGSTFFDNYSESEDRSATRNTLSDNPLESFVASTPRSYLVSTIASLRDRASAKPILSDNFISRINKYLSFK